MVGCGMGDQRVSVYEAINETLKEIFVGMTYEGMHKVLTRHRSKGPPEICHWKADHAVNYLSIQPNMAASHAADFAAAHALSVQRPGWKVIVGAQPRPTAQPSKEPPL